MVFHDDDDDDDSATTWGRHSEEEESTSLPQIPPQESETSSSFLPSPTTQTLNVLSQNMDDLRYDSLNSNSQKKNPISLVEKEKKQGATSSKKAMTKPAATSKSKSIYTTKQSHATNKTSTNNNDDDNDQDKPRALTTTKTAIGNNTPCPSNPNDPNCLDWKEYQDDWIRLPIHIDEDPGSILGMRITGASFESSSSRRASHCRVLDTYGLARQHGIQPGDWIGWPLVSSEQPQVRLAEFELVQQWSKERPFHVCVVRRQTQKNAASSNTSVGSNKQQTSQHQWLTTKNNRSKELFPTSPPKKAAKLQTNKDEETELPPVPTSKPSKKDTATKTSCRPAKETQSSATRPYAPMNRRSATGHFLARAINATNKKKSRKASATESATTSSMTTAKASTTATKTKTSHLSKSLKSSGTSSSNNNNTKTLSSSTVPEQHKHAATKTHSETIHVVVPFCCKCNTPAGTRQPRMHHSWCPHNDFFEDSGADDILERVHHGLEVDCRACQTEYQTGKLVTRTPKHNAACRKYQERVKQQQEAERQNAAKKKEKKKEPQQGPQKKCTVDYLSSSSDSRGSDDHMDDVSCYKPRKRKSKIHVLSVGAPSTSTKRRKTKKTSKTTPKTSRPKQPTCSKVTPPVSNNTTTSNSRTEELRNQVVKANWVSCDENPWGPPGHTDGDVLLYGPQQGMGHYEIVSPSKRYTLEPFSPSSSYRNTHCTPQEGFTMLSLRREPLSRLPWGFKVGWDEFGHACLVESIDRLSPAAAASFVGEPVDASSTVDGLKVNDMILSINGKLAGGMTEVGVELELETCGPNLLLVVSRYKHATLVQRKFVEVERQMLHVIDSAARDDRLLGWIEVGNAKTTPPESNTSSNQQQDRNGVTRESGAGQDTSFQTGEDQDSECDIAIPNAETETAHINYSMIAPSALGRTIVCEKEESDLHGSESVGTQQSKLALDNADGDSETWKEDENAWNGCVCGKIHVKKDDPDNVFWIQCESCESWYDVSKKCVGFNIEQAKATEHWNCWACPSVPTTTKVSPEEYSPPSTAVAQEDSRTNRPGNECKAQKPLGVVEEPSFGDRAITANSPAGDFSHGNSRDVDAETLPREVKERRHPTRVSNRVTSDGRLLPKSKPKRREDGTFCKPSGHQPEGLKWDYESGMWVPRNENRGNQKRGTFAPKNTAKPSGMKQHNDSKSRGTRSHLRSNLRETPAPDSLPPELIGRATGAFHVRDLVYVKPHSWPGKNCQGGIGHIVEHSYEDEEGALCYTVRFAIGSTEKFIEAEYISFYTFG